MEVVVASISEGNGNGDGKGSSSGEDSDESDEEVVQEPVERAAEESDKKALENQDSESVSPKWTLHFWYIFIFLVAVAFIRPRLMNVPIMIL